MPAPPLDAIATLLDQGAADSAVRLLRSCWEPELPADDLVRMYCMWIRGLCETGMTAARGFTADPGDVQYPRMLRWLRAGIEANLDRLREQVQGTEEVLQSVQADLAQTQEAFAASQRQAKESRAADRTETQLKEVRISAVK